MLFEQVIANNPSLQPYEYISTEMCLILKAGGIPQRRDARTAMVMCISVATAA